MIGSFTVRKDNMMRLVLDKFQGNKAAFSRVTGIHQNHVNLMASDNPNTQRNMGEELARRIESAIQLPNGWMDVQHGDSISTFVIRSMLDEPNLSRVITRCSDFESVEVTKRWVLRSSPQITAVENLRLATVATSEMEPSIKIGSNVIIDAGRKAATVDGIYILSKGDDAFLRSMRKQMDGSHAIGASNPDYRTEKPELLKGMKVVGKIVSFYSETML